MPGPLPHLGRLPDELAPLGWTGRDAEWITLVCLHSGVFVRAQFCHHYQAHPETVRRCVGRLCGLGVATEAPLPGTRTNQKLCHIHARGLYRTLGVIHLRHRRRPTGGVLWRRLLSLDAVIQLPDLDWLPTEEDKVRYFTDLGIDPEILPRRVYTGKTGVTTRYFGWKLPIAGSRRQATFIYVDPGLDSTSQLKRWCVEHEALWAALRAVSVEVHVHAVARTVGAEQRTVERLTHAASDRATAAQAEALSSGERETLETIEAAMRSDDEAVLERWGGFIAASRVAAPLRTRAKAAARVPGASIDRILSHVASRVVDDVYAA